MLEPDRLVERQGRQADASKLARSATDCEAGGAAQEDERGGWLEPLEGEGERREERVYVTVWLCVRCLAQG